MKKYNIQMLLCDFQLYVPGSGSRYTRRRTEPRLFLWTILKLFWWTVSETGEWTDTQTYSNTEPFPMTFAKCDVNYLACTNMGPLHIKFVIKKLARGWNNTWLCLSEVLELEANIECPWQYPDVRARLINHCVSFNWYQELLDVLVIMFDKQAWHVSRTACRQHGI